MTRIVPAAHDIERHIIGAILLDHEAMVTAAEMLRADDFHEARHAELYRACLAMHAQSRTVDAMALSEALTASGRLALAGGDQYLMEITQEVVTAAYVRDHCAIVRDHSRRRNLIRVLGERLEDAWNPSQTLNEAIGAAQSSLLDLGDVGSADRGLRSLREVFSDCVPEWQAAANGTAPGLLTGLACMDELIGGFRPGTLNVIAARPGMGKSMLTLQIALRCKVPVALYSLEMMAMEQAERLIAQKVPGLDSDGLRSASILRAKQAELTAALQSLSAAQIHICDNSAVTPTQIAAQCRRMKHKTGLGLIVVDYLQLVQVAEKYDSRVKEVGAISKFLKRLANDLRIPVIAVGSLSRDCEKREDKRPILSDLRESGEIESDAHTVTFIYRHSEYDKSFANNDRLKNITEIIVRKNRGGKKGTRCALFDGARSVFYDLDHQDKAYYSEMLKGKNAEKQAAKPRERDGWGSY